MARISAAAAGFSASPVAAAGRIYLTSEDGDTFMLKAGPKHEIVRVNTVDEPVYSSAALANGRVYIRGEKHLFAIGRWGDAFVMERAASIPWECGSSRCAIRLETSGSRRS